MPIRYISGQRHIFRCILVAHIHVYSPDQRICFTDMSGIHPIHPHIIQLTPFEQSSFLANRRLQLAVSSPAGISNFHIPSCRASSMASALCGTRCLSHFRFLEPKTPGDCARERLCIDALNTTEGKKHTPRPCDPTVAILFAACPKQPCPCLTRVAGDNAEDCPSYRAYDLK